MESGTSGTVSVFIFRVFVFSVYVEKGRLYCIVRELWDMASGGKENLCRLLISRNKIVSCISNVKL